MMRELRIHISSAFDLLSSAHKAPRCILEEILGGHGVFYGVNKGGKEEEREITLGNYGVSLLHQRDLVVNLLVTLGDVKIHLTAGSFCRLKNGVTRFGRATNNDFYLDSTRLKNFISRLHAEIHCEITDGGETEFRLYDKGLNGTFVNDRKMNGPHVLEEGDIVTFGHTNGFKLKPGDYAKQPNSEFQFVFERILEKEEETGVRTGDIPGVNSNSPRNDTANTNGYQSNQLPGNRSELIANSKYSLQKEKTELYNSPSTSPRRRNISGQGSKSSSKSSATELYGSDSDTQKGHQKLFKRSSPTKNNDFQHNGPGFQNLSDLNDIDSGNKRINIVRTSPKGKKRKLTESSEESKPRGRNNLQRLSEDLDDLPSLGSTSSKSNDSEDDSLTIDPFAFPSEDTSTETMKKKKRGPAKKKTGPVQPKETKGVKKRKMAAGAVSKSNITKPAPEAKKKKGKGVKRGRRKRSDSSNDDDSDEEAEKYEDLEDGVEWYEEDKCSALDCKRPKHKRVAWVSFIFKHGYSVMIVTSGIIQIVSGADTSMSRILTLTSVVDVDKITTFKPDTAPAAKSLVLTH
ncbi:hypothetical protein FSP39_016170 [Pinctada imbricata]|uniref:FHA domain-containing protein n=1 Tax=Pinctada imbricata TaxID=66713 RepID=A0AA88YPU3_PINIB|nr:hypothetical protein FSP39_016170 [Pinctada imbricata]